MQNRLLRAQEIPDIHTFKVYREQADGYAGLEKALKQSPADVIQEVKDSGLRGRGGAGFPTGVKWSFIPQKEPVKYVAVNADESETGTFKDRQIMEENPHQLIEGALICAYAIQATAVYIYIRGEYLDVAQKLQTAIDEAYENGFAGDNIAGSDFSCPVYIHLGAGAYICGEESAMLNSLEGKLGQPRVRPPFPAQKGGGLYAEPTVVNNVETLANVPFIMLHGADEYKSVGTEQSAGTKIFCVSGNVKKPGNYELPFGTTFRELLYDYAGGPKDGHSFKAILPSGGSGPIVPANDEVLDTKMSYEHTNAIDTIIGSASVIVMDDSVDITWVASKVTKFFHHESCGKCTPCREGTYWLDKLLDRIMKGEATKAEIERIDSVAKNMQGITLCALGEFAANPIIYTVKNFKDDFLAHTAGDKEVAAAGD